MPARQRAERCAKTVFKGGPDDPGCPREVPRSVAQASYNRDFVALYRWVPDDDLVWVLAIRAQREAGYKHD